MKERPDLHHLVYSQPNTTWLKLERLHNVRFVVSYWFVCCSGKPWYYVIERTNYKDLSHEMIHLETFLGHRDSTERNQWLQKMQTISRPQKVKPNHLYRPPVSDCSISHNPAPSLDKTGVNLKQKVSTNKFFPKILSAIINSSRHSGLGLRGHLCHKLDFNC